MNNKWETCPLCNGKGQIHTDGTVSIAFIICPVCSGEKIIDTTYGKPPSLQPFPPFPYLNQIDDRFVTFTPNHLFTHFEIFGIVNNCPPDTYKNIDESYTVPWNKLLFTKAENGILIFKYVEGDTK
jgi:hypothetical protein